MYTIILVDGDAPQQQLTSSLLCAQVTIGPSQIVLVRVPLNSILTGHFMKLLFRTILIKLIPTVCLYQYL